MAQQHPSIGRRVHYLDGTIHLTADICAVYPGQVVDLFAKDQVLGTTYFRYAVPFDAAAAEAGTWHWPEAVPPRADVGVLVPPAVPVVAAGDVPVAG
jgi:hypothetical protein